MNYKFLRGFIILVTIVSILLVTGYFYQTASTKADLKKYQPLGQLIEVDGLSYHLHCLGTGSPVVILEAGLGESSLSWLNIQTELSQTTKVCSYDRSGFGWSEGNNKLKSSIEVATNLHKLLQTANVSAPYVMVGHSRGGIFVRNFQQQFPNDVVAMVLIDSTHENSPLLSLPYVGNYYKFQKVQMQLGKVFAPFGIFRLIGVTDAARQNPPLAPEIISAKTAVQNRTASAWAFANEIFVMQKEGLDPITPPAKYLGDLPLIVLSAADNLNTRASADNQAIALSKLAFEEQEKLAKLSTNSQWIQIEDSGHYIMWDQPNVVIESILKLLTSE